MNFKRISGLLSASFLFLCVAALTTNAQNGYARDAAQRIDTNTQKRLLSTRRKSSSIHR